MNFGSKMRGYSSLSNDASNGYANQWMNIAPIRHGPKVFRIKPKVCTVGIRDCLMDESKYGDRIHLWQRTLSSGDHTKHFNNSTQVLNLSSGPNPNPTIIRRLEDIDYRCEQAKYKQEDLLPLSRLPRSSTTINTNPAISEVYTKPMDTSFDISRDEIRSAIHGKIQTAKDSNKTYKLGGTNERDGDVLYGNISSRQRSDIPASNAKSILTISGTTSGQTSTIAKIIDRIKGLTESNKIINIPGLNTDEMLDIAKIIKKITAGELSTNALINVPHLTAKESDIVCKIVDKIKLNPKQHKVQVIYKNETPNVFLIKKISQTKLGSNQNITIVTDNDRKQPSNAKVSDKIKPTESKSNKQISVSTGSEKTQPNTSKNVERVHAQAKPNIQYKVGHKPNELRNEQNINLQYKNQLVGKTIDVDRYSPYRPQFNRGININAQFRYADRTPFEKQPLDYIYVNSN